MERIAKRYSDALVESASIEEVTLYASIFKALDVGLNDAKVTEVFTSPYMDNAQKEELLLAAVESAKSDKVNNLIKLLVEKKRTKAISAIASSLASKLEELNNSYEGEIQSNIELDDATCKELSENFSKKADSTISLSFEENKNYDGIKMNVDSLGLEVGLSRTVVKDQMIQHILKSI